MPRSAGTARSVWLKVPLAATARTESAPTVMMPVATSTAAAARPNCARREGFLVLSLLRRGSSQGIRRARRKRPSDSVMCPDLGVRTQPPSCRSKSALSEA